MKETTIKTKMLTESFEQAKVICKELNVKVELIDECIRFDNWVEMYPDTIKTSHVSLRGKKETISMGWVICEIHSIPQTYWEPEDCDIIEVAQCTNDIKAIQCCINKVKQNEVDQYFQYYIESRWHDENPDR